MTAQPPEGQPGTILGPQPCPQGFGVQLAQTQGGPMVVATFIGPCGQWVVFLDVGSTAKLIDQLTDAVAQARSGIVIARGAPPSANGHGPTIEHRP